MDKQEYSEFRIFEPPKPVSIMKIGKEKALNIPIDVKFNRLQKFMWRKFFNVIVEDYSNG